jgi:hypothetical protein
MMRSAKRLIQHHHLNRSLPLRGIKVLDLSRLQKAGFSHQEIQLLEEGIIRPAPIIPTPLRRAKAVI